MPSEQAAKRGSAKGFAVDRLSALPDGLLHAVLSFLAAPQVVRTCVLSRRWRDLWRTAPCINIDKRDFGITSSGSAGSDLRQNLILQVDLRQKWRRFKDFTTNLLLLRSGAMSLDKFRLYSSVHCRRDVDRWVRRGIKCCPQVLEVLITGPGCIDFWFPHLGPSSCRLKRLHLTGVCLDGRFAEQIQSRCPVLEDLDLRCCRCCSHSFQEIGSPTLKRLTIYILSNTTGDPLVIRAPCLVYLQMSISYGCYSNGISAMRIEESDKFPTFPNLQTLSLMECFREKCDLIEKLEALGSFLQNAPCLEKLTLQCCMFQVDSEKEGQIVRKSINLPHQGRKTFQCQKLKSVEVFYEADHDNKLIELLWGIGRILPNATITLTKYLMD